MDDNVDSTTLINRNFIRKIHPYFTPAGRFKYQFEEQYTGSPANATFGGSRNFANYGCNESGLCIYGASKDLVLPPYEFTENNPDRPRIANPYVPVSRRSDWHNKKSMSAARQREHLQLRDESFEPMGNFRPQLRKINEKSNRRPRGEWTLHGFRKHDLRNYQVDPDLEERVYMYRLTQGW